MSRSSLKVTLVSVIVPCRNERAHLEGFCEAVLSQVLPAGTDLEVLIADGQSDDGTREWLAQRMATDPRLVLVDNPKRIVSPGLNACIAQARGEVLVRMDVHSVYAPDYIAACLEALAQTGADNVGGAWVAKGHSPTQKAIAAAFQSPWVAGGARSRDVAFNGWVDTVYLGAWPRASFERFGGFDENLVRNQDDEHNLRITQGGGRIWQSASIKSSYFPRASLMQVWRQYMQYGYWKPFVMRKHGTAASWRHLVPGAFVAACLLATLATLWLGPWPLMVLLGSYLAMVLLVGAAVAAGAGWTLMPTITVVIMAYHLSYGWGSLRAWWDITRGRSPSPRFAGLTR